MDLKSFILARALAGGGGTGGTSAPSDWNAAEGEPGHVLNRTHYAEKGAVKVAEAEYTFEELPIGEVGAILQIEGEPFEAGKYYFIQYESTDGNDYAYSGLLRAQSVTLQGMSVVALGYDELLAGVSMPVWCGYIPAMSATIAIRAYSNSASGKIAIWECNLQELHERFIPVSMRDFVIEANFNADFEVEIFTGASEILAAHEAGRRLSLNLRSQGLDIGKVFQNTLAFVYSGNGTFSFSTIEVLSNQVQFEQVNLDITDGTITTDHRSVLINEA